eukprot:15431368-Alexandrium_andersonii.AAC.2
MEEGSKLYKRGAPSAERSAINQMTRVSSSSSWSRAWIDSEELTQLDRIETKCGAMHKTKNDDITSK